MTVTLSGYPLRADKDKHNPEFLRLRFLNGAQTYQASMRDSEIPSDLQVGEELHVPFTAKAYIKLVIPKNGKTFQPFMSVSFDELTFVDEKVKI